MRAGYEDVVALATKAGVQPLWWDANGVPRYAEHHPRHAADIYASEVAFLRIACQRCSTEQLVQMTWSSMDTIQVVLSRAAQKSDGPQPSLAELIRTGTIHYGDPPHHDVDGEFCHAGCTMNCEDLAVVEYWHRDRAEWRRNAELEITLTQRADDE